MILLYGIFSYFLGVFIGLSFKEGNMVNLNKLAAKITEKEGLKKSLTVAQVKEVMKLIFLELKTISLNDLLGILKRYK